MKNTLKNRIAIFRIILYICFIYFGFSPNFIFSEIKKTRIVPCAINVPSKQKGEIAVCMIFYNESRFIKEWIEYHKLIGIDHFYLYNNGSTDDFWEILLPYVLKGDVELFDIYERPSCVEEHNQNQKMAYNHALYLSKNHYKWLAIIDSDEFICMPKENNLKIFLDRYDSFAGLVINWVMYGSSGVKELCLGDLQIEKFIFRAPDDWHENRLFKSIVKTNDVLVADIHNCYYRNKKVPVYPDYSRFSHNPLWKTPPISEIRINHYWWRDEKYFSEVKRPRRFGWKSCYSDAEVEKYRKIYNSICDPSMEHMVEPVKASLY